MTRKFTIQCAYNTHYGNTVTVEADSLDEALEKAIETANEDPAGWRGTDHCSSTHVDAVCEGADCDPWGEGALPVPDRFPSMASRPSSRSPVRFRPAPSRSPAAGCWSA